MSLNSYINYDEPRTVGLGQERLKSVQAWKTKSHPEITSHQSKQHEHRTAFAKSLEHKMQAYKPAAGEATITHSEFKEPLATVDITTSALDNKDQGFKFSDVIDTVNPLHHIPIIGSLYRHFTGDKMHPMSGVIGGAIYGGPVGAVSGTVNAVSQVQTGQDIGEHGLGLLGLSQPVPINDIEAKQAYATYSDAAVSTQTLQDKINQLQQSGIKLSALSASSG